jgi:pimeloyl-ACP methyl ester carboxylesterase
MPSELQQPETVVLIHGWISHRYLMKPLEWRIQRAGYATRNWGYRSLRASIEDHAEDFASYLHGLDQSTSAPFHIITHSMGSIVTRWVLQHHQFAHLGRIVMLCPPNRGSHMARRVSTVLRGSLGTLDQISDRPDSFVNQLPLQTGKPIGIVVASGDRVVRPDATQLADAADTVHVPGMHNTVLFKQSVVDLCVRFLKTGKFTSSEHAVPTHAKTV